MPRLPCLRLYGRSFPAPPYGSALSLCAAGRVERVAAFPKTAGRTRRGGSLRVWVRLRSSMWRYGCRCRSASALLFGMSGLWYPRRCRARSACPFLFPLLMFLCLSFLLGNHTSPLHVFQFIDGYLHHLLHWCSLFSTSSHRHVTPRRSIRV